MTDDARSMRVGYYVELFLPDGTLHYKSWLLSIHDAMDYAMLESTIYPQVTVRECATGHVIYFGGTRNV